MSMKQIILCYGAAAVIFLIIDFIWLGTIAKGFYDRQLPTLLRKDVNWPAAIAFYALYIFGITYFAIAPAMAEGSVQTALIRGAVFGLVAYGTFDLTNWALIRDWPATVVAVDMVWGLVLTGATAASATAIAMRWG